MTIHLGFGQYNALASLYDEGSPVSVTALSSTPDTNCIHPLQVEYFHDRNSPTTTKRFLTAEGQIVDTKAEAIGS